MKADDQKKIIPQTIRDLLLAEMIIAYREVGELLRKSRNPDTTQTLLDMKRGLDMALCHLSPLNAQSEKQLEQLRTQS